MKIDRLLEIIIYLLNNENVSANYLAKKFNVSVRTIQRDMVSISAAGIPVYSNGGKYGGYSILSTYKIKNADIKNEEQQMILQALKSLATSYRCETLSGLIEKYNAIIEKEDGQKIFWDFSITKENNQVQESNRILECAVKQRAYISFEYRNANGDVSQKIVEPLAIHYKWYAWYLFSFDYKKNTYITFKVARMKNIQIQEKKSHRNHGNIEMRMKESEMNYYSTSIEIIIQFHEDDIDLIREYFPDCIIKKTTCQICRTNICVPEKERLWKVLLLSFGNRIKIISPESYKNTLIETAQKFISNYDI